MNKTINISLNGLQFCLEENAYKALEKYLANLRNSMNHEDGVEEIIQDIESRIAELFYSYIDKNREVVNLEDVNKVIGTLGTPEQVSEFEEVESTYTHQKHTSYKKKLYRDPENKILGGVLAGISHYFGWNTSLVRILFVLIFVFPILEIIFLGSLSLTAIISYIVLWIFLPKAITSSEKMEMHGTPVNIGTIAQNALNKDYVKKSFDETSSFLGQVMHNVGPVFDRLLRIFVTILKYSFGLFIIGLGFTVFMIGMTFLKMSITSEIFTVGNLIFEYSWQYILLSIFAILSFVILGSWLIYGALKLISKKVREYKSRFIVPSIAVFTISILGLLILTATTAFSFTNNATTIEKTEIPIEGNSLSIQFKDKNEYSHLDNNAYSYGDIKGLSHNEKSFVAEVGRNINIKKTSNDKPYLELEYNSRGKDNKEAQKNANRIKYDFNISDGKIVLDEYFSVATTNKYRSQDITFTLYLPENMTIKTKDVDYIFNENQDEYDLKSGKEYEFNFKGDILNCINCDEDERGTNIHIKVPKQITTSQPLNAAKSLNIQIEDEDEDEESKSLNIKIDKNGIIINNDTIN